MTISPTELSAFSRLIDDLSGIVIDDSKSYLVEHRLNTVLREHNLPSYAELYHRVRYDNDTTLTHAVIDAITTNETLFFRDTTPYDALRNKVLPHLFDRFEGTPRLRIWSAACSTGQEPYSIAMTLRNLVPDIDEWDVSILGTDISDAAIGQASRGVYSEFEMQRGLSPENLSRYFRPHEEGWRIQDELRSMVEFRTLNLHHDLDSVGGPFDIIFCRNVAIYFADAAREHLFRRLSETLAPHGALFVGAQESLDQYDLPLIKQQHCRCMFYCGPKSDLLVA